MTKVKVNNLNVNYEQQGSGEPLILIPFLTADNTCYTFQVAEYSKHFTCISVDLRGAGETDKPAGAHSTEMYADDVAGFMDAIGVKNAHVMGLSLGAGTGLWLAAKYPDKVKTLSVHSGWTKTDLYTKTIIEGWQVMVKELGSVTELVIRGIFPWCFTPNLYVQNPESIDQLSAFVRSRPAQPVEAFMQQSNAVLTHDVEPHLNKIKAPTLITFGIYDLITSVRYAEPMQKSIPNTELIVFENASHGPIYEIPDEFNQKTLTFLQKHSSSVAASSAVT
jgi:pimeloyl-ACP methyl ester carboxylesterase